VRCRNELRLSVTRGCALDGTNVGIAIEGPHAGGLPSHPSYVPRGWSRAERLCSAQPPALGPITLPLVTRIPSWGFFASFRMTG
jgi:hypothetical protein